MVFQSTGQPPFDSLNVLYTLSWVQHPTSVIFAIIKRKVSGHFKGFDPLKRCFPSLFPPPAPFWVTAAGETKTSRMENFGSMGTTPTHPLTLESVPLKPVWPVRSQCGSVCSQPASLARCAARKQLVSSNLRTSPSLLVSGLKRVVFVWSQGWNRQEVHQQVKQ